MIFNLTIVGEDDDGNQGQRPRPAGPSSVRADSSELDALRRELWAALEKVRGPEQNWKKANQWMIDEMVINPDEAAPKFTADKFREVIKKVKAKLA
jgi:hypothetical protein